MYSIGEIAKLTGITAFTLRYYEKVGVLPEPRRQDGIRRYDAEDLQFIRFIHSLKQTGMSLEDIAAFTEDGCLLSPAKRDLVELHAAIRKRMDLLNRHMVRLDEQIRQLNTVKSLAQQKTAYYSAVLVGKTDSDRS
jgi:MerR family transcriptional regulator, repressor of the yfmOP operon